MSIGLSTRSVRSRRVCHVTGMILMRHHEVEHMPQILSKVVRYRHKMEPGDETGVVPLMVNRGLEHYGMTRTEKRLPR